MNMRKLLAALVCVLMIGALVPTAAGAAFYNSRSTSADAMYSSWDWQNGEPGPGDATVDWYVGGMTGSGIFKDAGVSSEVFKDTYGVASMYSYAPAAGDSPATWTEFTCLAMAPDLVLAFGKSLGTANMEFLAEATVNVWYDVEPWVEVEPDVWEQREPDSTSVQMVSVMAEWQATGPLNRSQYMSRDRSDDLYWADRSHYLSRAAKADVSIVGADGTEYLVEQLGDAMISQSKTVGRFSGSVLE